MKIVVKSMLRLFKAASIQMYMIVWVTFPVKISSYLLYVASMSQNNVWIVV
jgi:hypothetical protein